GKITPGPGGLGGGGDPRGELGGLSVCGRVGQDFLWVGEHGVPCLGQSSILHDHQDFQIATVVDEPVHGSRCEPEQAARTQRCAPVPGSAQGFQGTLAPQDHVTLGGGGVQVGGATCPAVLGEPV